MKAGPPNGRGVVGRLAENPGLVFGALVFTIVAGVVAVATFGLDVFDRLAPSSQSPAPSGSASVLPVTPGAVPTTSSPGAPTTAAVSPAPAGSCLDDDGGSVDCREPHRFEQFGGPCSTSGMIEFMAGQAGLDVVLARVSRKGSGCLITVPVAMSDTAARALAGSHDDAWRRCVDSQQNRLVGCDQEHTGEYLSTGAVQKARAGECDAAAEKYMDQTLDNVSDVLVVRVIGQPDKDPAAPRCLIEVRGSQPLTASVRGLGVSPVPIRR